MTTKPSPAPWRRLTSRRRLVLAVDGVRLRGDLAVPRGARGLVVFVPAGGDRRYPRHRAVARSLARAGFATLLLDLLTPDESAGERAAMARAFDLEPLAGRLVLATERARLDPALRALAVGYFAAGAGAAVALAAAARRPPAVRAVVCDAGRLGTPGDGWSRVEAATLLIADGDDPAAAAAARAAFDRLGGEGAVARVGGASRLAFAGAALEAVSALSALWFGHHLSAADAPRAPWGEGGPAHCEAFRPGRRPHHP